MVFGCARKMGQQLLTLVTDLYDRHESGAEAHGFLESQACMTTTEAIAATSFALINSFEKER